jgi:hypothetical protein
MSRTLATCWHADQKYLLQVGTRLIVNALEQQDLDAIASPFVLDTAKVDVQAGSGAYLDGLVSAPHATHVGADVTRHDLFLSYASPDTAAVRELATSLAALGVDVWIDREQIGYGAVVQDEIDKGIVKARFFGFIITPSSLADRPWVRYEQSNAWQRELAEGRVVVIPILLEGELEDLPEKYRKKRCVDLRGDRVTALRDFAQFLIKERSSEEALRPTSRTLTLQRTPFPMVSVDAELVDSGGGEVHRYELHLRAENPAVQAIDGFSIDIWFPALACFGNQGFHTGLGSRGPRGTAREQVGVRWQTLERTLSEQEVVICPTRDCHHPYRVDHATYSALGSEAEMNLDVFATNGRPMRGSTPWPLLHIY